MTFGDKLSKLRKENNYTQEQLADVLSVSRQAISKWESDVTYPETDKLIKICNLFQCSTDYLLIDESNSVGMTKGPDPTYECLPNNQLLLKELQAYIDTLFAYQKRDSATTERKEKLMSCLTKRINDLITQGQTGGQAFQIAKASISTEEWLLNGNQLTDMAGYKTQCLYSVLLNCTLFWIFTMPLLLTRYGPICFVGLAATLLSGILYSINLTKDRRRESVSLISVPEIKKKTKVVWELWGLFFLVYSLAVAAATFGSDLWFGRPVEIAGPYAFANIAVHFYIPILTVFFPITVNSFTKSLSAFEKRDEDEKE